MNKKLFIVISLAAIILSACGAQTPSGTAEPTVTLVVISTNTQAPPTETLAPTETIEALPTDTPAPEIRPTNVAGCTNKASFVADITVPDNTQVNAGAPFTKTWRISNTGTCVWASDYTLSHYSDERMGTGDTQLTSITYPGQTADITVELTAPNSPGKHRENFVIKNPEGLIMSVDEDSRLWFIIDVVGTAVAPTATSAQATATSIVATAIPTNTIVSSSGGNATCAFTTDAAKIAETINAINTYRTASGLPAYNIKEPLTKAAQSHASDMACNNLTGHTGSDGSTPGSRISGNGYVAAFSAENLNVNNPPLTGQAVVDAWKAENNNLVSDTYIDVGVGYAFFNNNGYYVVVFATP